MSRMQASMLISSSPSPSLRTKKGNQKDPPKVVEIPPIMTGRQHHQSHLNVTSPHDQSPRFQKPKSRSPGMQRSSSMNRKVVQSELSPPVPVESFEMVRSKMRESISASLSRACDEKGKSKDEVINSVTESSCERKKKGEVEVLPGAESDACDGFTSLAPLLQSSENLVIKNDIFHENALCWASDIGDDRSEDTGDRDSKRPKLVATPDSDSHHHEASQKTATEVESHADYKSSFIEEPLVLATKIEAELFRQFGGVNKKYKEKGRSLLFNLKDRNNPELRRQVLAGEIAPKRLCCMTAEELASKELSQWRIAKAEERAQMIVLPDSDGDIRRMVKKNHKGEYLVEYEYDDIGQVDKTVTSNSLSQILSKRKQHEIGSQESGEVSGSSSDTHETEVCKELGASGQVYFEQETHLYNPNTSLFVLEDVKVEESKCSSAYEVPTLDEFVEELSKRPPFGNPLVGANVEENPGKSNISEIERSSFNMNPGLTSETDSFNFNTKPTTPASVFLSDGTPHSPVVLSDAEIAEKKASIYHFGCEFSFNANEYDSQSKHGAAEDCTDIKHITHIWEGLVQLNISSLANVLGVYKSGEQASTTDWPTSLEIKGRVRLDAFKKFLQELPLSKSRAVMVLQLCWKEGSPEDGRDNLCETIDSYVADERVGYAEPVPGVEIYFCPPHEKTTAVLIEHLAKDHVEIVKSIDSGFIGVVVWRRPLVSNSEHRSSSKKHSSRKQHNANADSFTKCPVSGQHVSYTQAIKPVAVGSEPIDDTPPGFGPAAVTVEKDEDDLPEFSFSRAECNSSSASVPTLPVEQMRHLIHKYGQNTTPTITTRTWNGDNDDDIPEWKPKETQPQPSICQPPLPPGPPPQPHPYQNEAHVSLIGQRKPVPFQQQQQPSPHVSPLPNFVPQQLMHPLSPFAVGLHFAPPQMMFLQSPPALLAGWQLPGQLWHPASTPTNIGFGGSGMVQPYNNEVHPPFRGHPPGNAEYNGWRPDFQRNR